MQIAVELLALFFHPWKCPFYELSWYFGYIITGTITASDVSYASGIFFENIECNEDIYWEYVDMLRFDEPVNDVSRFTKAFVCSVSMGVGMRMGAIVTIFTIGMRSRIFVNESLLVGSCQ